MVAAAVVQVVTFFLGILFQDVVWPCQEECEDSFAHIDKGKTAAMVCWFITLGLSYGLYYQAYLSMRRGVANVELLMTIAIGGSVAQGDVMSGAMVAIIVMVMDQIKEWTFEYVERTLKGMVISAPSTISIADGREIPNEELQPGMVFLVRVGEAVPADGTVVKGKATVDESSVTGEALPIYKEKGSTVVAGSIVQEGFLQAPRNSLGG